MNKPLTYRNYTNVSSLYDRGYEANDTLVPGYSGTVEGHPLAPGEALEVLFNRHNRDDRPDGQMCPSMSIGDVVVLSRDDWTQAFTCETFGFARVTEAAFAEADVDHRAWTVVIDEARKAFDR